MNTQGAPRAQHHALPQRSGRRTGTWMPTSGSWSSDTLLGVRSPVGGGNSAWTARNEFSHSGTRRTSVAMLLATVLPYKEFRATAAVLTHIGALVLIEIAQQCPDVTTLMQDTQTIDMVGAPHVEDRIREVVQRSSAQPGNTEPLAVARRTDTRVASDRAVGGLQRNSFKAQGHRWD